MAINEAKYRKLAKKAKRLIDKAGRDMTLVKLSEAPLDPEKPWRGTDLIRVNLETRGAAVPTTTEDAQGNLIRRDSQTIFLAAEGTDPDDVEEYDLIYEGHDPDYDTTDSYRIDSFETIKPGDVAIVYQLEVSR